MAKPSPYLRSFAVGAVWFAMVGWTMVSRHPGHWSTYPPRNLIVVVVAWMITAALLGVAATQWERLRSWGMMAVGSVAGSALVMGAMLFTVNMTGGLALSPQKFESTDAMMAYLANETTKWVEKDRGVRLDYSFDSIEIIEEELARISKEVDKANPQRGTLGVAMGYGAYIGEVIRRRDGGSWAEDDPMGGKQSFPLTTTNNVTVYPVGWCWKRLTIGEEDNVYSKARLFSRGLEAITNAPVGGSGAIHLDAE